MGVNFTREEGGGTVNDEAKVRIDVEISEK